MIFTSSAVGFFLIILLLSPSLTISDPAYNVSELYYSLSTLGIDFPWEADELITNISVPICCPPGQVVNSSECIEANSSINITLEPPELYTENFTKSEKNWEILFSKKYGIPCKNGFYALVTGKPYYETPYLLENGTLFINQSVGGYPDEYITSEEYCLANIIRGDNVSTVVAHCHPELAIIKENIPITYRLGLILSTPFFAITFLVYAVLPELRNIHGLTLMAYVGSHFVAYFALIVVAIGECAVIDIQNLCISLAFVIHFSFLASFFWLNVMCFDIWWTFGGFRALQGTKKQLERKKFLIYSGYAWGCAGIFTGVCLIMDFHPDISSNLIRPEFGKISCWFSTDAARAIYFYGPMGVTVICNIILFISTAIKIVHHKKETAHHLQSVDSRRHDDNKQWFNLYLKLFIVMGINWSMEIVSWLFGNKPDYLWYITDIANTLQGLVIFIIFVWKQKIKRLLLKRFGCKESRFFQSRNSTRSAYHSSMSTRTNTSTLTPLQDKFKMTTVERTPDEQTDTF